MTTTPATAPPTSAEADVIIDWRRAWWLHRRVSLGASRARRPPAGKDGVPRDKVCGDGLTPRAVKQLVNMGIDVSTEAGWLHNKGLRIMGAGHELQLHWPELSSFPDYGLVRPAVTSTKSSRTRPSKAGAHLRERTNVTGPILDERSGRILGVTAKPVDERGRQSGDEVSYRSRLVIAADGNSTRLSLAMGLGKRDDRPMGVAVRTYYKNPNSNDDWLESWLGAVGRREPAARLWVDFRHGRRHVQRRARHAQHVEVLRKR